MSEDVIQRLFNKIDDLKDEISGLKVDIGKLQTKLEENEKIDKAKENGSKDIRGTVAWIATTAIALYGALKN